jgi:hypothetical protein
MAYPSTFSSFNRPTTSDRLNNPSHSALHNTVSSALGQVEAVIGLSGDSSTLGTIIGDLRSPDSNGGGHIQAVNKGGTGQTSYTKGDLLVATSSSVLAKLVVGSDNQVLIANSSTASGVNWGVPQATKISATASIITVVGVDGTFPDTSILSVTIPGSTLGTSNVIRYTGLVNNYTGGSGASVLTKAFYGNNQIGSVLIRPTANSAGSIFGEIKVTLFANNSDSLQRGILEVNLRRTSDTYQNLASVIALRNMNTTSVQSSANQTLGVVITPYGAGQNITIDGTIVEKIV